MKKDKLKEILDEQEERLVVKAGVDVDELRNAQELVNNIIATKDKISALNSYVEDYKDKLYAYMSETNINVLHSTKGKATCKVADKTSIKKDLVLKVIDEFRSGKRESLDFKDVTETKSSETFLIKPINIEEGM